MIKKQEIPPEMRKEKGEVLERAVKDNNRQKVDQQEDLLENDLNTEFWIKVI